MPVVDRVGDSCLSSVHIFLKLLAAFLLCIFNLGSILIILVSSERRMSDSGACGIKYLILQRKILVLYRYIFY